MKKALVVLVMSLSSLVMTNIATAAPHFDEHAEQAHKKARDYRDSDKRRSMREERGVQRLQQFKWQPGYVMPQHYRSSGYKVGFKENNLPRPNRNQQWYKVNNDYILVDSNNNNILRIQNN